MIFGLTHLLLTGPCCNRRSFKVDTYIVLIQYLVQNLSSDNMQGIIHSEKIDTIRRDTTNLTVIVPLAIGQCKDVQHELQKDDQNRIYPRKKETIYY